MQATLTYTEERPSDSTTVVPRMEVREEKDGLYHAQRNARRDEVLQLDKFVTVQRAGHQPQQPEEHVRHRQRSVERKVVEARGRDVAVW